MEETWKDVVGYEGRYKVSNLGRVKSLKRKVVNNGGFRIIPEQIKKATIVTDSNYIGMYPHLIVVLYKDNIQKRMLVHRLVLEAFVGACPDGMIGCHNDGNGLNNKLGNLRWDTPKSNTHDSIKHGTFKPFGGKYAHEENHRARFNNYQVMKIRELAEIGTPRSEIEKMFGAKNGSLSRIITGKQWIF